MSVPSHSFRFFTFRKVVIYAQPPAAEVVKTLRRGAGKHPTGWITWDIFEIYWGYPLVI